MGIRVIRDIGMRGGLRGIGASLVAGLLLFSAGTSVAEESERRIVGLPKSDYFGGDYDILKNVDANICETACLADDRCQAFTLNTKTKWCFLKESIGELRFKPEHILPRSATEYVQQNVWMGVSFPSRNDVMATREVLGVDRFMWGSDFPHDEGTSPFTREHLRQLFFDWPEADVRKVLAENAADVYGFDLAALAPEAAKFGPLVSETAQPLLELPAEANEALLRNAVPAA